jgi:hypothetical protein
MMSLTGGGVLLELTYRAAVDAFGVHGAAELCYLVKEFCPRLSDWRRFCSSRIGAGRRKKRPTNFCTVDV